MCKAKDKDKLAVAFLKKEIVTTKISEPLRMFPFRNRTSTLSQSTIARSLLQGIFLVPPRLLMMTTAIATGAIVSKVCTLGVSEKDLLTKPLTGWRATLRKSTFRRASRLFLMSLGFNKIHTEGHIASRDTAPIIVCNHQAPWEAIALSTLTEMSFISSDANFKMPILGNVFFAAQHIRVDRTDENSRSSVEKEIRRRARNSAWNHVAIFPEGTCGNGTCLMTFRLGAFTPSLAIQPVVVRYTFDQRHGIDPAWAGYEVGLVRLAARLMCQLSNHITLTFLEVIQPTEAQQVQPLLFSDAVRARMAKALNVPLTPHSVDDTMLQVEAIRLKFRPEDVVLGMDQIRTSHRFSVDDVKEALQQFKSMDVDKNRILNYGEFLRAMCMPDSLIMKEVWSVFTQGQDLNGLACPMLRVKDYIYSAIRVAKEMSSARLILASFRMIDLDGDDFISFDEWLKAMQTGSPDVERQQALRVFRRVDVENNGVIDVFDFGRALREKPTWMCFFLVLLSKQDTDDGRLAASKLNSVLHMCQWRPPNSNQSDA